MTTKKLDRRVRRTRRMLRDALLELLREKEYDNLTVQDITNRAELRRATFYLHYKDKDALLVAVLMETFDALVEELEPVMQKDVIAGKTSLATYRALYMHMAAHADRYRFIFTEPGTTAVARKIRDYLAGHIARSLRELAADAVTLPVDVVAHYIAGSELALMTWWLENDQPHSPDDMAQMTQQLVFNGVRGLIRDAG
ncbi:MAG: TetR/AcrR family transcriptional regulator [Chloroflexi bacterium]|nr:MAG: TetR/AcrR family transcriptional regulator [Chloroflexota bacterium]